MGQGQEGVGEGGGGEGVSFSKMRTFTRRGSFLCQHVRTRREGPVQKEQFYANVMIE